VQARYIRRRHLGLARRSDRQLDTRCPSASPGGTCSGIEMRVLPLQTIQTIEHRRRKCSLQTVVVSHLAILCNLKFAAHQDRLTSFSSPAPPISLPDLASVSQKKLTEKQSSSRWPMLHVHTKHKIVKTKSDVRCLCANPPNIALTRIFLCQCTARTYYTLIMSCPNTGSRPSYLLPRGPFNEGCVVRQL
jgi:hypothetical protein